MSRGDPYRRAALSCGLTSGLFALGGKLLPDTVAKVCPADDGDESLQSLRQALDFLRGGRSPRSGRAPINWSEACKPLVNKLLEKFSDLPDDAVEYLVFFASLCSGAEHFSCVDSSSEQRSATTVVGAIKVAAAKLKKPAAGEDAPSLVVLTDLTPTEKLPLGNATEHAEVHRGGYIVRSIVLRSDGHDR
jgi:hypothetical protein